LQKFSNNNNTRRHGSQEDRIAYIDLFSGPGRYKNGSVSTPLMVLEQAIKNETFRERLVTLFNDADQNHTQTLQKEIDALPDIRLLKYKPDVCNEEIGDNIIKMFESMKISANIVFC
jgi:three-Cys-motif partner protein